VSSRVELRTGTYRDSVALMQLSRAVSTRPGVSAALVAMATDLNVALAAQMGFEVPDAAFPEDLLVAVTADDDGALDAALGLVDAGLSPVSRTGPTATGPAAVRPRTLGSAARAGTATLALVSTPGEHAFTEAMDALDAGLPVMVFSDNVPVEQEVLLKDVAARRDLLVMGPDCGTALVCGVGLGFANVVRPGPVGLVSASGTGAQQVMCLLDAAGIGVSHCLGVGGRDLAADIAGRSTHRALDLLDADTSTELIVVLSKPPAPQVAQEVRAHVASLRTPVVLGLLGPGRPDLTAVAADAVRAVGGAWQPPERWLAPVDRRGSYPTLRGFYAGGTLCDEAMIIAARRLGPVRSNIPLDPRLAMTSMDTGGHWMVDFGDDRLTRGRPHPMIDLSHRVSALVARAGRPDAGVFLLDVVLGHGAHPDPAAELAPAIREAHERAALDGRDLAVVVSIVGTAGDPQGLLRQAGALREAGASVHRSNADAARNAVELVAAASAAGAAS